MEEFLLVDTMTHKIFGCRAKLFGKITELECKECGLISCRASGMMTVMRFKGDENDKPRQDSYPLKGAGKKDERRS